MSISSPIGSAPATSSLSGIGAGGLLAGTPIAEPSPGSASTMADAAGTAFSVPTTGAAQTRTSASSGIDVASLSRGLFDALIAMGNAISAGRPDAPGASNAARPEPESAMEARLAATIASYFQH